MTSGGRASGSDVSCYHGDNRHMFPASTRGVSDADKCIHRRTHTHIHAPRASGTGNCQERSESTSSSFSGTSTARFLSEALSTQSHIQLIYSLLYSQQPLCLLFISAWLVFICVAISDISARVLFHSVRKVKLGPIQTRFLSKNISNTHSRILFCFTFILSLSTRTSAHALELMQVGFKEGVLKVSQY